MRGAFLSHGWLPAVLPAEARRFRVADPHLAYTLESAGAALVSSDADVEIAQVRDLTDTAPTAIVPVEGHLEGGSAPLGRIVNRLAAYTDVKRRGAQVRAVLEARGYAHVRTVFWDRDQPLHFDDDRSPWEVSRIAERFPRRVLVVASRHRPGLTVLERALLETALAVGQHPGAVTPLVASGTLVVLTPGHVLRMGIGAATRLIAAHAATLRALRAAASSAAVSMRIPENVGAGTTGVAQWTIERRMHGAHPHRISERSILFADCLQFLAALYRTRPIEHGDPDANGPARQAEVIAAFLNAADAATVRELSRTIDEQVGMLRTGFWHGDFWARNLLVHGEQLVGVIDWAQGGSHGLPLLDLINLELNGACDPDVYEWGHAFIAHLLPRTRSGPGDVAREYLRTAGLELTTWQYACLVAAYWLERVAHQLDAYVDRGADPLWVQRNVVDVLHAITAHAVSRPSAHEWPRRAAGLAG